MTLVSAVIAVSILAGLAVLVVIPILIVLYYRKHRQTQRLQHRLDMQLVEVSKKQTSMPSSHVNSLPCRLKKKPSSAGGSRSAAGESGVYDMSEISQLTESPSKHHAVTATYAGSDGTPHKLYLYGDLSSDDHLVVKEVISHHIHTAQDTHPSSLSPRESRISSQQSVIASSHNTDSLTIPDLHCTSRASLSLDDITITGLDNSHISYENEGYRKDEHENLNGTSKRRQQVKKTISALSNRMRMNIKREDKSSSRLSDSACHSPYATQKSAVIGQSGGEIILSGGVKLSIPPHALSDKVQITLGVTFDPRHQPHLPEEEGLITPIVFCQPSGLKFKHPATLSMPHCALQVQDNWRVNIYSTQSDVESTEETQWKILQIGEYESRTFHRHEVQLCVNHFTMYCVTGSSKSKRAACKRKKIIALASEAAENCFSVYCVNCYQQKVTQQNGAADSTTQSLVVESGGGAIRLTVEGLTDDWAYTMDSAQQISLEDAWQDQLHSISLSLQSKELADDITCDLCVWQTTQGGSHKYKVPIHCTNMLKQGGKVLGRKRRNIFTETLSWDLRLLLDPIHAEGSDWRKLSEELGLSQDTIKKMEENASPTKELLKIWEDNSHGCIKSFVAMAVKIGRLDVAEKIEEHVGKLYLETLPNHKCTDHC